MKLKSFILLLLLPLLAGAQPKWLGGDISMLPALQRAGVQYCDSAGRAVDPYALFRYEGWNMMRVRLFVDPKNAPDAHHDQGVCQDLPYVVDLCRTIKANGFGIMLDFHYSDTWADPAKQYMPKRWEKVPAKVLPDSIYAYTRACLKALKDAGAEPDMIQVGNEITFGMDWPVGRVDPLNDANWKQFLALLKAGSRACRKECPNAKIIIHTEKAGVWEMTEAYYQRLEKAKLDYDIIGLSYYPMWHNTIEYLGTTLDKLAQQYPQRPVMIVEAAYYYNHDGVNRGEEDFSKCKPGTIEGQRAFTRELVFELKRHPNVTGLFWWFPEENTYRLPVSRHGGLNRGLFNSENGRALPALYEMAYFMKDYSGDYCPKCGSTHVGRYSYGYIDTSSFSPEQKQALKDGRIILGGCCISDNSPLYRCRDCKHEWGVFRIGR